ncbi:hypothetical protein [Methanocella arvoryzae]|uniref:Uncharacterized protein n=1 Tax=Methanocella arvoryzae (strain DSM 22066 / NBRC 105507 / MRE50) TaxID=351160 RepID=Q0W4M1_METAR|nr:hypothetical protein [Methanocella arvoryzae]CAJ36672.1 conserved hypothetical protein [Methanocella arvoryzae MRE50]
MKKLLLLIPVLLAVVLISGCLNVAMYTKVDKSGNISNLKMEINTTSYVYNLMAQNIQSEGYSSMKEYILSNYTKSLDGSTAGNTVDYSEEWSGDHVKMIIDLKGSIVPSADSGIKISRDGDFLLYEMSMGDDDSSGQMPSSSEFANMSDAMLSAITFDYYLEMPGKIVDSNANEIKGNKAEWHFNGKTMASMDRLYAKSEVPKAPGFGAIVALLAVLCGYGLMAAGRKRD